MWGVWSFAADGPPQWSTPPVTAASTGLEAAIAWLAERQHGVVALAQLVAIGLSARGVRDRVATGALHRIHRGVYAVGRPSLTPKGHRMAAVLACGPGAVLSHRSAAALWGLRTSGRARIDITAPGRAGRRLVSIDAHHSATLTSRDITSVNGIPCTTVARTLLDLAEVVPRRQVEWALNEAEVQQRLDGRALDDVLARSNGRRGARVISSILAEPFTGQKLTKRELEERCLALCDRAGIPRPDVNIRVALEDGEAPEVDFLWRRQRLIVETDSWTFHRTRRAFERDRERDQRLMLAGYRVVRLTWRQILDEPARIEAMIGTLVAVAA
jgi:putative AbiEi antitoxin of type IV toxin-antitoxin system/uncharacterized protein DUF559